MELNIRNSVHYLDYREKLYVLSHCYYYEWEEGTTSSAGKTLRTDGEIRRCPNFCSLYATLHTMLTLGDAE